MLLWGSVPNPATPPGTDRSLAGHSLENCSTVRAFEPSGVVKLPGLPHRDSTATVVQSHRNAEQLTLNSCDVHGVLHLQAVVHSSAKLHGNANRASRHADATRDRVPNLQSQQGVHLIVKDVAIQKINEHEVGKNAWYGLWFEGVQHVFRWPAWGLPKQQWSIYKSGFNKLTSPAAFRASIPVQHRYGIVWYGRGLRRCTSGHGMVWYCIVW